MGSIPFSGAIRLGPDPQPRSWQATFLGELRLGKPANTSEGWLGSDPVRSTGRSGWQGDRREPTARGP